jgi:hypothetical protein
MQYDVGREHELITVMIARAVHEQQDQVPGISLGHVVEKYLVIFGTSSINGPGRLRADKHGNKLLLVDVYPSDKLHSGCSLPHGITELERR